MALNIGWAEVNITPEKRVSLRGQFAERISEYVEKPLVATVLAVEANGDQMILVSCDLASINYSLVDDVRAAVAGKAEGLDPMKIVLSAIHTHTGPGYSGVRSRGDVAGTVGLRAMLESYLKPGQKYIEKASAQSDDIATDDEVYELLMQQLPKAVLEAWNNRKPGSFSNAFGRAPVGLCRRAAYSDGTAQMWGDTHTAVFEAIEGGNDTGIELLYVVDDKKKLTGIVANLACPAQCVQHRLFVSPDFWGEVRVLVRKYFGEEIPILCQCSAAGDQCPVDLVRWVQPESDLNDPNCTRPDDMPKRKADPSMFDLAGMKKAGKCIAREIIEVWEEGLDEPQTDPVMEHRVEMMSLPMRRATPADIAAADKAIREYFREHPGDVDYNDVAKLQIHMGVLRRAKTQERLNVLKTEVHIIRLGTVAIATNPFELFLDYGNQIKARSLAEQTFLIQLANGAEGYLPTEKAEKHGHYSAFISSGQCGHQGGDQLVRETLQHINEMFAE